MAPAALCGPGLRAAGPAGDSDVLLAESGKARMSIVVSEEAGESLLRLRLELLKTEGEVKVLEGGKAPP